MCSFLIIYVNKKVIMYKINNPFNKNILQYKKLNGFMLIIMYYNKNVYWYCLSYTWLLLYLYKYILEWDELICLQIITLHMLMTYNIRMLVAFISLFKTAEMSKKQKFIDET